MGTRSTCIAFLVFVSFALYSQNLNDYFLADDFDLIHSFYGKPPSYLLTLLFHNESGTVWESLGIGAEQGYGFIRPVKIWLLSLDLALWGPNPLGFHLTATAVYALNVVLVFLILELLLPGRRALALLGAWTTAIHPVFSEIVPSITFREETLASAFTLLSFHAFLRHRIRGRSPFGFWLFYALGVLSKESALSGFGLAAGYDLIQLALARERAASALSRARLYVPIALILLAYFALRWIAFGSVAGSLDTSFLSARTFLLFHATFFRFLFHELMFELSWVPFIRRIGLGLVALALVFVASQRARLGRPYLALLVFLGPVWYLCSTSVLYGVYFSPRHNVVPVVGIILFLTALFGGVIRALRFRWERAAVGAAMALAALLFVPPDLRLSREYEVAADTVERVRARIEEETLSVPDGGSVLLRNVPQIQRRPFYFGWALQSALEKPFTQSDLANRVLVINRKDMILNQYDFAVPRRFDRVVTFDETWPRARPSDFGY